MSDTDTDDNPLMENLGKAIVQLIQDAVQEHDDMNPAHVLTTLAMVSSFFLNKLKVPIEGIRAWTDAVIETAAQDN